MSDSPDNSHSEMSDDPNDTPVMTSYVESDAPEEPYDDYDDDFGTDASLPGRPRRVLVNRYSAGLAAVLIGAACFYAGVRVEKSQVSSRSSTGTGGTGAFAALASRFGAAAGSGSSATARSGGAAAGRFGGAAGAGGFAGFAGAGAGGGTAGTISTIDGDTLYLTESSGNTVKVKLSSATTLTKTVSVAKKSLFPGDTVSVTGATKGGTVTATAVADSGSSSAATSSTSGTTGASSSSSTGSGASGLSSLFGG
jgi:hypothetical protein